MPRSRPPARPAPSLTAALGGDPARNLSRLVCGRLLAEQTDYLACVVPTFESGRRAGLGQDPAGAEGPAWKLAPDMAPVELPVYHHWRFATGPAGDFQSLALAIRGRTCPTTFGSPADRPVDRRARPGRHRRRPGPARRRAASARGRPGGMVRPVAAGPVRRRADRGAQHTRPGPGRDARARPTALRRRLPAGGHPRPDGARALVRAAQHRPRGTGRRRPRRPGRAT